MDKVIRICIYLDGELFGMRLWEVVPRVGDHIQINKMGVIEEKEIKKIIWKGDDYPEVIISI